MPIYSYQCAYCTNEFDEFRKIQGSGKSQCPKCGNVSFKIPAIFSAVIFKKREFADGTSTPDFVRTPSQERAWLKSQKITYEPPVAKKGDLIKEGTKKQFTKGGHTDTIMGHAFRSALDKCEQGFKIEKPTNKKETSNVKFNV